MPGSREVCLGGGIGFGMWGPYLELGMGVAGDDAAGFADEFQGPGKRSGFGSGV